MSHYDERAYNDRRRWASYWHQLDAALAAPPGELLLVGIGSGLVLRELQHAGRTVCTLDLRADLQPDVVASVDSIPLPAQRFAGVICCQVLEHLPWEQSMAALDELFRVLEPGGRLVLSLPDVSWFVGLSLEDGLRRRTQPLLTLPLPRLRGRHLPADHEHRWEIGRADTPLSRVERALAAHGFVQEQTFRVDGHPYHRFFLARRPR